MNKRYYGKKSYGKPCGIWKSNNGDIEVKNMSNEHILNCMKKVGDEDEWFIYFLKELNKRMGISYCKFMGKRR